MPTLSTTGTSYKNHCGELSLGRAPSGHIIDDMLLAHFVGGASPRQAHQSANGARARH
jgi:hypothetical protein